MSWRSRRVALALLIFALAALLAIVLIVAGDLLDPGNRQNTTPDVTPAALAPQSPPPRMFEVYPAASVVDVTAQGAKVALDGGFPVRETGE